MSPVCRQLVLATAFLTGVSVSDVVGQTNGILPFDTREYWEAFNEGVCLGHYNGRIVGKARGIRTGTEDGRREGYDSGWESTYQLAYDESYELAFDVGRTEGLSDAFVAAFWEGFETADRILANSEYGSGFGIYNGGLTLYDGNYYSGNGTSSFGFFGYFSGTHEEVYNHGYAYGYSAGDAEAYNRAYPAAYDAAFPVAFREGAQEGGIQGTVDGQTNGLVDGNVAGSREGWDAGYDEGYDYRMAGGARTNGQAFAEERLLELFGINVRAPQSPLSAAIEYGRLDDGALSVVPEPSVGILFLTGLILVFRRLQALSAALSN